jgi:hypothetical protein
MLWSIKELPAMIGTAIKKSHTTIKRLLSYAAGDHDRRWLYSFAEHRVCTKLMIIWQIGGGDETDS